MGPRCLKPAKTMHSQPTKFEAPTETERDVAYSELIFFQMSRQMTWDPRQYDCLVASSMSFIPLTRMAHEERDPLRNRLPNTQVQVAAICCLWLIASYMLNAWTQHQKDE